MYKKGPSHLLSFGTTSNGFPSNVTSKLIKTPIKMGEKINCTEGADKRYVKKRNDILWKLGRATHDIYPCGL